MLTEKEKEVCLGEIEHYENNKALAPMRYIHDNAAWKVLIGLNAKLKTFYGEKDFSKLVKKYVQKKKRDDAHVIAALTLFLVTEGEV